MSKRKWKIPLLVACAAAMACGDEDRPPVDGGSGGSAGSPGTGAGGTPGHGGGGSDGVGGSGGDLPGGGDAGGGAPGGDWHADFQPEWRYQGFGEVNRLAIADFLGDGTQQIAIGGRRPVLLAGDGSRVLYYLDWDRNEQLLRGGDNDWVYDLAAIPAEDGRSDLLITNSMQQAWRVDGRSGERLWTIEPELQHPFPHLALFGDPDDPLFLPKTGRAVHAAGTGEEVWRLPTGLVPIFMEPAENGGTHPGLFVVDEGNPMIGGTGGGRPAALASLRDDGTVAFQVDLAGEQPIALGHADLDGLGPSSALVSIWGGGVRAYDPDGSLRWTYDPVLFETRTSTRFEWALGADLDGDGAEEALLIARHGGVSTQNDVPAYLIAVDADGTERWRFGFLGQVNDVRLVERGGDRLLLLATGGTELGAPSSVLALQLRGDGASERFGWHRHGQVAHLGLLDADEGPWLVLGSPDGILRTLDDQGREGWEHFLNGFINDIAAVPVGSQDGIALGDTHGTVALVDAAGKRRWHYRLDVGAHGRTTRIRTGRVDPTLQWRIVAAAAASRPDGRGVIEVIDLDRDRPAFRSLPSEPVDLHLADIDGDGVQEILVLETFRGNEDACHVRAYDGTLELLWEARIFACQYGEISVADMDGDGAVEIAVRTDPGILSVPSTLSILGADGRLRWLHEESFEKSMWSRAVPGGIVSGGVTTDRNGFAGFRSAADGKQEWKTLLAPKVDVRNPDGDPLPGASWHGLVFPTEDGLRIAANTYHNDLYLLDVEDGSAIWMIDTEREENYLHGRHVGGPLVLVAEHGDVPAHLVMAQFEEHRRRSEMVAITLDGGIVGRLPMDSPASRIVLANRSDGPPVVVAKALLGLYAARSVPAEE